MNTRNGIDAEYTWGVPKNYLGTRDQALLLILRGRIQDRDPRLVDDLSPQPANPQLAA